MVTCLFEEKMDISLSTEKFVDLYTNSQVVATESILDFFNSIRDKLIYLSNRIYNFNNDYITIDVNKYRHQTLSIAKKLPMSAIADKKVSKPLNFSGLYIEYTPVISRASWVVLNDLTDLISLTIKQTTTIINNSVSELKNINYLDTSVIKKSQKVSDEERSAIAKFFPYENNTTVALFKDLFISPNDFVGIFREVDNIDECLYQDKIKKNIKSKIDELYELMEVVINLEISQKIFDKHSGAKTNLIQAMETVAKETETLGYIYANINFLYKALQDDCLEVIETYKKL